MSAEDLAKGMALLEHDEVQARVAEGDLSDFAGLELTEEEIGLLEAAMANFPEVVGFDIRAGLMQFNLAIKLEQKGFGITQDVTVNKAKTADKAFQAMDGYIRQ